MSNWFFMKGRCAIVEKRKEMPMKTDLVYSDDVLYVNVEGNLSKKGISSLQRKMYSVISAYGIEDVVINIKGTNKVDKIAFYDMLDDYDAKYGGNLKIMEK